MDKKFGVTIHFDLAYGKKELVSLYGINEDFEQCYDKINSQLSDPKRGLRMMSEGEKLIEKYYNLVAEIENKNDKKLLRNLLLDLDKTFLDLLCYYLYFVYLGYGGNRPNIAKFLKNNKEEFERIRNCGVDTHMDKEFPRLFGKLNPEFSLSVPYFSRKELIEYLKNKQINTKKINGRKKEYLLITKECITKEYFSGDIEKVFNQEVQLEEIIKTDKIIGTIACSGLATGKAKVIFTSGDYKKIKEGDVIITPMTKPDIAPYLKKVKGIITDDGGVLCHASIISREMNIPCIIGTKIATKVLKDGDLVEVDAEKGIVKIIKKA